MSVTYPTRMLRRESALWERQAYSVGDIDAAASVGVYSNGTSSAAWPTANTAIYVPVRVRVPMRVTHMWYASETVGTDNIDLGIYNASGTRLVSTGAIAKVASATARVEDITDTSLAPGLYYLAMNCASATATFRWLAAGAPLPAAAGLRDEAVGATALPSTATWSVAQTLGRIPMIGMLRA